MFIVSYVVLFIGGMLLCGGGFLMADVSSYMEHHLAYDEDAERMLSKAKGISILGGLLVIVGFVTCMAMETMV